jgi:hypothetical protein
METNILKKLENEKGRLSSSKMSTLTYLSGFFDAIERDPRINSRHIGIYAALLRQWALQGGCQPLEIYSHELIRLAKLSSRDTYFKYIGQLHAYGYIRYERSFNHSRPSRIYLTEHHVTPK